MRIPLVIVAFAIASACTDEVPSQAETHSAITIDNRLSANRLSANRLSANRLSANRLSANRLSANRLELDVHSAEGLLATAEGREVLSFIVSCAVDDGESLVADFEGTTYEFFGELGLAERWLDHPLDKKGRGWVSACLFARVNANDVLVTISLRGDHRQLTTTPDERATWSLEEGAFYGDFFTPLDKPIDWNACRARDQAAGETGGLVERDCTEPDPARPGLTLCGFTYAGDCGFTPAHACKHFDRKGTFYERCANAPVFGPHHDDFDDDDVHVYREVITTYVQP